MSDGTPGPWVAVNGQIVDDNTHLVIIADCRFTYPDGLLSVEEQRANENKIAAAPEMLKALKGLLDGEDGKRLVPDCLCLPYHEQEIGQHTKQCVAARRAIDKAEGR